MATPVKGKLSPLALERPERKAQLAPVEKEKKKEKKVRRRRRGEKGEGEGRREKGGAKEEEEDVPIGREDSATPRPFAKGVLERAELTDEEPNPFAQAKKKDAKVVAKAAHSDDPFDSSPAPSARRKSDENVRGGRGRGRRGSEEEEEEEEGVESKRRTGKGKYYREDESEEEVEKEREVESPAALRNRGKKKGEGKGSAPPSPLSPGRRDHFDLVLVFDLADKDAKKAHFKDGVRELTYSGLSTIFDHLREEGLSLHYEKDNNELANKKEAKKERVFVLLTASQLELEQEAEKVNLRKPLKIPKVVAEEFNLPEFSGGQPFRLTYAKISAPFTNAQKNQFHVSSLLSESGDFVINPAQCEFPFFNEGERQMLVYNMIHTRLSKELLNWEAFCEVFPLHVDESTAKVKGIELEKKDVSIPKRVDQPWLVQNWLKALAKGKAIGSVFNPIRDPTQGVEMPLNAIRRYFGDSITFYFAWMSCYTKFLSYPALLGIIFFVLGVTLDRNGWQNTTMPLSEATPLRTALVDPLAVLNPLISFSLLMWASYFINFWERKQNVLAFRWGTFDLNTVERTRPKFKGVKMQNKLTLREELVYSSVRRRLKQILSVGVLGVMVVVVGIVFVQVVVFRFTGNFLASGQTIPFLQKYGATFVNSVTIILLGFIYRRIAILLTNWENYKYQSEYDNALIIKAFTFNFVNSFTSCLYLAFFRGAFDSSLPPTTSNVFILLQDDQRLGDLATQVGMNIVVKFAVSNAKEIILPFLLSKIRACKQKREEKNSGEEGKGKDDIESKPSVQDKYMLLAKKQANLSAYTNLTLLDDYIEVILLYAYVACFGVAFPLAPTIVFVASYLELGVDAFKLCKEFRRPMVDRSGGIPSSWLAILRAVTRGAVLINVGIVVFITPNLFPNDMNVWMRLTIGFAIEHGMFFLMSCNSEHDTHLTRVHSCICIHLFSLLTLT